MIRGLLFKHVTWDTIPADTNYTDPNDADEARAARNVAIEQRDAAIARATAAERALAAVQSALPISDADLARLIALLGPYGAFAAAPRSFGGPPPTQLMRDVGAAIEGELRRRGLLPFTSSENLK